MLPDTMYKHVIDNDIEKAEFYYKVSSAYYYVVHTWESIEYLRRAKEIFERHEGFEKRKASCSVLLGLNCIDISQYEQAEIELLNALDFAKSTNDIQFKMDVYHNLGLFYSHQNHSTTAIRYLNEIEKISEDHKNLRVIFLLTQEYCKIGDFERAYPYFEKGMELSHEKNDEEYQIKFEILQNLYIKKNPSLAIISLNKGIEYFKENNKWYTVGKYSEILANIYNQNKKYEQASHYFSIFVEAYHKINEMGALK